MIDSTYTHGNEEPFVRRDAVRATGPTEAMLSAQWLACTTARSGRSCPLVPLLWLLAWTRSVVIADMSGSLVDSQRVPIMEAILKCLSFIESGKDVDVFADITCFTI
jgi:hypothetical protein